MNLNLNNISLFHLLPSRGRGRDRVTEETENEDDLQKVQTKMGHIDKEMPSRPGTSFKRKCGHIFCYYVIIHFFLSVFK